MCGVDADSVCDLGANSLDRALERFAKSCRHVARCDCNTRQVCHFVCLDRELLTAECARTSLEHQVENIFSIDAQSTELRAAHFLRIGYGAGLVAVTIEGEAAQLGSRNVYGVPLENDGGLGGIATAEGGCRGRALAKCAEDVRLKLVEGSRGVVLRLDVARNFNIDYAAR